MHQILRVICKFKYLFKVISKHIILINYILGELNVLLWNEGFLPIVLQKRVEVGIFICLGGFYGGFM